MKVVSLHPITYMLKGAQVLAYPGEVICAPNGLPERITALGSPKPVLVQKDGRSVLVNQQTLVPADKAHYVEIDDKLAYAIPRGRNFAILPRADYSFGDAIFFSNKAVGDCVVIVEQYDNSLLTEFGDKVSLVGFYSVR